MTLNQKPIAAKPQANNQIRARSLRVVDAEGVNRGVMETQDALSLAREQGLDLVVVTEKADPPVARILDYGKYIYQLQKKEKRAGATQVKELKTVQIKVKTSDHDLSTKAAQIEKFLTKGHNVRVHIYLRGREKAHQDLAKTKLEEFIEKYVTAPHKKLDEIKKIPTGYSTTLAKQ